MGPFGIPWDIAIVYIAAIIGVPVANEILLHSRWWQKQCDYYHSFNDKGKKGADIP